MEGKSASFSSNLPSFQSYSSNLPFSKHKRSAMCILDTIMIKVKGSCSTKVESLGENCVNRNTSQSLDR